MSKVLVAIFMMSLAYVSVNAKAEVYPQAVWTCTYLPTSTTASDPNLLQMIPGLSQVFQIDLGPQSTVSRGSMTCASPALPAIRYEHVLVKTDTLVGGVNVGLRPYLAAASFEVKAGISTKPRHMFGKFALQGSGNANILIARLGGTGSVEAGPGELAGTGSLSIAPETFSIGADGSIGTMQVINLDRAARR